MMTISPEISWKSLSSIAPNLWKVGAKDLKKHTHMHPNKKTPKHHCHLKIASYLNSKAQLPISPGALFLGEIDGFQEKWGK